MKLAQIKEIAAERGIKLTGAKKADIVRAIQRQEGNEECFGSGRASHCGQHDCLWLAACD
jgi:hypothetical protein